MQLPKKMGNEWITKHYTETKSKRKLKGQSGMNNPEILATLVTQDTERRQTKQGAIRNGQPRDTGNIGYTRHRTKTNKTKNTTQKPTKMRNTDPTKNREWTQVLTKGKQFLLLIRHPLCFSYTQMYIQSRKLI